MKKLDDIDRKILDLLQKDARISNKALALEVGLSVSPTYERVKRLEREGYIRGYKAICDPKKLGLPLLSFCQVSLKEHSEELISRFQKQVQEIEEIVSCYHGVDEAKQGKEGFQQKIRNREFPNDPDATVILRREDFTDPMNPSYGLVDLIMRTGLTPSRGEARRLIVQGAVIINKERCQDVNDIITLQNGSKYQMKIGKRKYVLVKVLVD